RNRSMGTHRSPWLAHGRRSPTKSPCTTRQRAASASLGPSQPGDHHMKRLLRQRRKARLSVESLEARNLLSNVSVNDPSAAFILANGLGRFTQSETSTAVANDGTIISAFKDSEETIGNIFTRDEHATNYAFSTDGGKTFTDAGSLPESDDGDGSDPILAVNWA